MKNKIKKSRETKGVLFDFLLLNIEKENILNFS